MEVNAAANGFLKRYFPDSLRSVSAYRPVRIDSIVSLLVVDLDPGGWILLSADKRTEPVLGFSFEGDYTNPENNDGNPGFMWIKEYHEQIIKIKDDKSLSEDPGWKELTVPYVTKNINSSGPWVNSFIKVTWGQGTIYNLFCPSDPDGPGGHTWAGCVAVCMAQAMSVFSWPYHGTGSHSYVAPGYGTQYVNFGAAD